MSSAQGFRSRIPQPPGIKITGLIARAGARVVGRAEGKAASVLKLTPGLNGDYCFSSTDTAGLLSRVALPHCPRRSKR